MTNEFDRREFLKGISLLSIGQGLGILEATGAFVIRYGQKYDGRNNPIKNFPKEEEVLIGELKPLMNMEAFEEDMEISNALVVVRNGLVQETNGDNSGVEVFSLNRDNTDAVLGITIKKELFIDYNSLHIFLHRMKDGASNTDFTYISRTASWIQEASNSGATNINEDGSVSLIVDSGIELSSRFSNCLTSFGEGNLVSVHMVMKQDHNLLGIDEATGEMVIKSSEGTITNIEIKDINIPLPTTPYPDSSQSSFFEGEVSA